MSDFEDAIRLVLRQQNRKPWFWKPQWHWFGWKTLIPFNYGHDEYARRTLLLGWTVTGRAIFPLWYCGDKACFRDAMVDLRDEGADDEQV